MNTPSDQNNETPVPHGFRPLVLEEEGFGKRGLRSYLLESKMPYYSLADYNRDCGQRRLPDESNFLDDLEKDGMAGLLFHGEGGIGKTRLTYELGKMAEKRGWRVLWLEHRRAQVDTDLLEPLRESGTPKTLILFDYVETLHGSESLMVRLGEWAREDPKTGLRYIANCRGHYYRDHLHQHLDQHCRRYDIGPRNKKGWRNYQTAIYKARAEDVPQGLEIQSRPLHAALIAYITKERQGEDFSVLARDHSFQHWAKGQVKRLATEHTEKDVLKALATLFAILPISRRRYLLERGDSLDGTLCQRLLEQGWIEYDEVSGMLCAIHDVFADHLLYRYHMKLEEGFEQELAFLEILEVAANYDNESVFLASLNRAADKVHFNAYDFWLEAAGLASQGRFEVARSFWTSVLAGATLTKEEQLRWLCSETSFWMAFADEVMLGTALAQMLSDFRRDDAAESPLKAEVVSLIEAVLNAQPTHELCVEAYLTDRKLFRGFARRGIFEAALPNRQTLICEWLRHEEPDQTVVNFLGHLFQLNEHPAFLMKILEVAAEGPWKHCMKEAAVLFFEHDPPYLGPSSYKVYEAWLRLGYEVAVCRPWLEAWLPAFGDTVTAQRVYRAWLEGSAEVAFMAEHLNRWLARRGTGAGAYRQLLQLWLERTRDLDTVAQAVWNWFDDKGETRDGAYLLKEVLLSDVNERSQEYALKWLEMHAEWEQAYRVVAAWLEGGGAADVARSYVQRWAKANPAMAKQKRGRKLLDRVLGSNR